MRIEEARRRMVRKVRPAEKIRVIGAGLATLVLAMLAASPVHAEEVETDSPRWGYESAGDLHRYLVHGSAVWGHELGFFKNRGSCDAETLWITWSAINPVKQLEGVEASFELIIGKTRALISLDLLTVFAPAPGGTQLLAFTNFLASEALMDLFKGDGEASLRVVGPPELVSTLDFQMDRFGLKGFAAARAEADAGCRRALAGAAPNSAVSPQFQELAQPPIEVAHGAFAWDQVLGDL